MHGALIKATLFVCFNVFISPLSMPFCCWKIEKSRWIQYQCWDFSSLWSKPVLYYVLTCSLCGIGHRARSILGTGVSREEWESLSNTPLPITLSATLYTSLGKGDHISFCPFDLSVSLSQKKFPLRSCWSWIEAKEELKDQLETSLCFIFVFIQDTGRSWCFE